MKLRQLSDNLFAEYHKTRSTQIRNKLVMLHQGLVKTVAYQHSKSYVSFEDLTQIGTLGLIKAIERYEPTRPYAFVKYAKRFINGEILHYFRDRQPQIKPPRSIHDLYFEGLKVEVLSNENAERDLARSLNISVAKWLEAKNACQHLVSLDNIVYEGSKNTWSRHVGAISIVDTLGDPTSQNMWAHVELNLMLDRLNYRRRRILELYYLEDKSKTEIGRTLNISFNTVQKHLAKGISQLRNELCQA